MLDGQDQFAGETALMTDAVRRQPDAAPDAWKHRRDAFEPAGSPFWWARIPILAWGAWTWIRHLRDDQYQDLVKGLNLGLHEMGHLIFGGLGEFPGILGGSLFQCLCPAIAFVVFLRQRDRFGLAFCFAWLGSNLFDVAAYIGDARAMELPLVSPFGGDGEVIHDWNWILGRFGWLPYDQTLAGTARLLGSAAFLLFLIWGSREVWRLRKS